MSPSPKNTKRSKALTVEFSGISTLIWNQKAGTADVYLADLASLGFPRHYAALSIAITETTPHQAIKGPDADAAISVAQANMDIGLWNLMGTDVEIVGATGKLSVDDTKPDVSKEPGKRAESIRWLADVGLLCESDNLDPLCPVAATIRIPAGHITAAATEAARKLEFVDNGTPVIPDRYCTPRFKAVIPFTDHLAIRINRNKVLRFNDSMRVVVSNTCVCDLGLGPTPNHFYGHYGVIDAKRRPTVRRAGRESKVPSYPEICFSAIVRR